MNKLNFDFDDWFETLCNLLLDAGINFRDADAVRDDYEAGLDVHDVVDDIKADLL